MILSDIWRLSVWLLSVCLSRTSGLSREQRGLTEVAHITRDSDTTFMVKRSPGRFGWLFKSLHNLYGRHHVLRYRPERAAACRPWGGGIVWRPPAYSLFCKVFTHNHDNALRQTLARWLNFSRRKNLRRQTRPLSPRRDSAPTYFEPLFPATFLIWRTATFVTRKVRGRPCSTT